jgi:hypothetical protein
MKTFLHSLSHFLSFLLNYSANCHLQRLSQFSAATATSRDPLNSLLQLPPPETVSILCCNCHFFSLIFTELKLRLTAHLELRNSTNSDEILCPFYNPSARTAQKTQFFYCCVNSSPRTRATRSLHSNGCVRHISCCDNPSIVACGHYLATTVSLALQFFPWANTQQCICRTEYKVLRAFASSLGCSRYGRLHVKFQDQLRSLFFLKNNFIARK